jgi:phosphatidylglycerophosphate synthase
VAPFTIAPQHLLSITRVALGLVLCADLRAHGQSPWALPIAVCAVGLDIADGRVARASGTSSATGRFLDNGSDAVFIAASFTAFVPVIGSTPLVCFALAFGSYGLRALVSLVGSGVLAPSPRGHWAGMANYALVILAALAVHPALQLPTPLLAVASAAVAALNVLAFSDNSRLLWQLRRSATPPV